MKERRQASFFISYILSFILSRLVTGSSLLGAAIYNLPHWVHVMLCVGLHVHTLLVLPMSKTQHLFQLQGCCCGLTSLRGQQVEKRK